MQGVLRYRYGINVERWRPPSVTPDWRLAVSLLAQLRVDTVLDVGAYDGRSGHMLRRAGFEGRLISFEPSPAAFRALEETARDDPNWTVVQMALGSEEAERELEVRAASSLTSFLPASDTGLSFSHWDWEVTSSPTVSVQRLDDVLDRYTQDSVFAKIDTQGFDLEVVRGATGVLDRIKGLHVELAVQPLYVGQPDYLAELGELRELGYEPVGLFPQTFDVRGRLVEVNGLFVRGDA